MKRTLTEYIENIENAVENMKCDDCDIVDKCGMKESCTTTILIDLIADLKDMEGLE